jgi:regulator of sirC expression with transglutaminase-like and TPR domain
MSDFTDGDIHAMILLLEDDDEYVVDSIRKHLLSAAVERSDDRIVPRLRAALETASSHSREHLETVLEEIRWAELEQRLHSFVRRYPADTTGRSLEEGTLLLASFAYPGIESERYRERLDRMAEDLTRRLSSVQDDPMRLVGTINAYLFSDQHFRGNREDYFDPDNSYINRVIDRKTGIPITLSAIYLFIAQRLALPIYGVGMPGHFIVKYEIPGTRILIDPFNGGMILTQYDCMSFLASAGYGFREEYLATSADRAILLRMITNLVLVYVQMGDTRKAEQLARYAEVLQ